MASSTRPPQPNGIFDAPTLNDGIVDAPPTSNNGFVDAPPTSNEIAQAQSAGAASNNKPTRSRVEEGCRLHVSPGRSRLPTRLRAWEGDSVDRSGKISSFVCGLNSVARRGASNKKFWQRSGTPWGRRHATTSRNLVILMRKVGIKCSRVRGRVHRHVGGGEVIRDIWCQPTVSMRMASLHKYTKI